MNKNELVEYVCCQTGTYKKDVKVTVEAVLKGIERGLVEEGKVTLTGFGNFIVKTRGPRVARNPQTGEEVRVPPKRVVSFRPSGALKDAVE